MEASSLSGTHEQNVEVISDHEVVQEVQSIQEQFIGTYTHPWVIVWLGVELTFVLMIILLYKYARKSSFVVFFEMMFEKVFEFFEELLGKEEKMWIKTYVTIVFFIILFSNLLGVILEFLMPIFGEGLHHTISIPTADINFNIAMAVIWVTIVIIEQFKALGFGKFLYEYFPVLGKDYIPFKKGNLPKIIDIPVFILVKIFDIIISVFLGLLEIVGIGAKIISLAFRLFWNMTAGGILLGMLYVALGDFSASIIGTEFPILVPILVYTQELLISFIQAFVFPLLIAIFVKVAKLH
mgnify:FL=1